MTSTNAAASVTPVTPGLSIHLQNFTAGDPGGWQFLLDRARAADQAGIDRLSVSDHVVFGEDLEAYGRAELGGSVGGKQPTGPDGHWLEPMTLLSVVSGVTSRIRLSTGILIAALRRPVVLAKTAATLDVLSGGRLDLGVGVGWQREEYEAAGLSFEGRGKTLDHTLAVCQTIWREMTANFDGDGLHFEAIHCMPKPVRAGGVPLFISGTINPHVVERIVRFGSGWIPWGPEAREPAKHVSRLYDALAAAGRDPAGFEVLGALPTVKSGDGTIDLPRTMDGVPDLVKAGITDFRLNAAAPTDVNAATDFFAGVVQAFRAAVGR